MRTAAIQMCSGIDIADNIASASQAIRTAAGAGAQLIVTPEMTNIVQRSPKRLFAAIQTEDEAPEVRAFARLAEDLNVTLVIGSMAILNGENRAVNRCYVFGPNGDILARYDKIHLFDVQVSRRETWRESNVYNGGVEIKSVKTDGFHLGLSICYDVRFSKLYRAYGQRGVHIITVPSAFTPPTGEAHWEVLLRARAIETGAFIVAPAQGGVHADGRTTWGHSLIIDPWGGIIAASDHDQPDILYADIDLSAVETARTRIPAWQYNPDYTS